MQREILFKAKRKDNGEWTEGNLVYVEKENSYNIMPFNTDTYCYDHFYERIESDFTLIEVIPETICQYTGLTDKNSVKIFENDIVRLDDKHRKLISSAGAKTEDDLVRKDCLVGFKNGSFMFCRNRYVIDGFDSYLWLSNEHCEVIGNIFDEEVK